MWLYFRFCLSYGDVEELMAERGILLTFEAVPYWCQKFGQAYGTQLRRTSVPDATASPLANTAWR